MSATIALQDGVLLVQADPNTASIMQVQFCADHRYVHAYTNGAARTFQTDRVSSIKIVGSNLNDNIYVDPRLNLPAQIEGGAGDDVIKGGTGFDTIDGGAGNNLIYGHGILSAGLGNDTIWGSNKGDVLIGGPGKDLLIGGQGNNTIYAGSGDSTLIAGQGNDKLVAGDGNDALFGANGRDTLVGGPGRDTLYGGAGANILMPGSTRNVIRSRRGDVVEAVSAGGSGVSDIPPLVSLPPPPLTTPAPAPRPPLVSDPAPVTTPIVTPKADSTGPATKAVIDMLQSSVLTGEGIEVSGLNSVLHSGSRLSTQYQWDFGDPGSSYNNLTGWSAGHVYDHAGVYTITLTVTDASGQQSTASSQVSIGSDNRPVIYVDTNGSDSNSGASQDQAVQTAAKAFALAGDNTKIEFRRGETFFTSATLSISGHDIYVGAYGDGASPVISKLSGPGQVTIYENNTARNITIQGLTFDSPNAVASGPAEKVHVFGIWAEGINLVVRDNTFLNIDDAVNGSIKPTGVIVQDNTAPLLTGLRGYFAWVDGTDWTIVGNTVANSTREHVIRSNSMDTDRVLIADNNLSKPWRADDPGEVTKCTINFRAGHDIYITGNTLTGGTIGMGPGPWTDPNDETSYVKIDGNVINAQIYLAGAVHHAIVSNNVLNLAGASQIHLRPDDPYYANRHMTDVTITNNTGINDGTTGTFLEVTDQALPGTITVTGNLYEAPKLNVGANMSAPVLVEANDLSGFAQISGNVWPANTTGASGGGVNYVWGTWFGPGWQTPQQWSTQGVVQGDQFQSVSLPAGTYQMTVNGSTAGANLKLAA